MSLIKYYDALFEDEKLNSEYVTYLSAIHMMNTISKRDNINNKILKDLGVNYSKKALVFYESAQAPLTFLNDDVQIIYDFTKEHINKILKNPHKAIVKEQKLIKKEKLKSLDSKSLKWLANKPGSSVREKLANVEKISSTVKRYSYNIKENQVLLAYFKDISKILNKKIGIMNSNPELFGQDNLELEKLKRELNKKNFTFRTEFEEVVEKDYSSPNNALIGNVDYSSVWSSYLDLKQTSIDYSSAFEDYKKSLVNMLIAYLMNYYDFIEEMNDSSNLSNYVLYSKENDELQELLFDNNDYKIMVNKFNALNTIELLSSDDYVLRFEKVESDNTRGLPYNLYINDKMVGKFYSDILGFKEAIVELLKNLNISLPKQKDRIIHKNNYHFISINSFDNRMYNSTDSIRLSICDNGSIFNNNSICFANDKNLYYYSYKKDGYSKFLRQTSLVNEDVNKHIIYDINDTFDEFSSATVRRVFSSIYPKSYPVWRSILAGEASYNKAKVRTILDFCGKNFSISKLERKNDRFVHCGPIEVPIYYQIFNEFNFYESYISKYQNKYSVSYPNNVINEFMASGALHSILYKKLNNYIVCDGTISNHKYYVISFDDELFDSTLRDFEASYSAIIEKFDKESTLSILPDFLECLVDKYGYIVCNKYLINGANEIIERLDNNEITWYEKLPKLSLEIIKDGMFDNLVLVDNQECENIIGKKFRIVVKDKLTLSKGNKNYILPLNKSFIGSENDSFVAKADDPSFPLKEDIDVRLIIEYSFGAENSYLLKLIPVSKTAPFEEIIVKWEKETIIDNLLYPSIINTKYNDEAIFNICSKIKRISEDLFNIRQKNIYHKVPVEKFIRDIKYLANDYGRVVSYSSKSKEYINNIVEEFETAKSIKFLKKLLLGKEKYSNFDLVTLEVCIATLEDNDKYFVKGNSKSFVNVENCYGRYLANRDNINVLKMFIDDLTTTIYEENYLYSERVHQLISSISDMVACNYLRISELTKISVVEIRLLLESILKIMEDISNIDYSSITIEDNYYKKRFITNIGYSTRQLIEILIAFLFCREQFVFSELKPSGKTSKRLISILKEINRNYYIKLNDLWEFNGNPPRLTTKYNMIYEDKDGNLNNMWNEAYCLILYLSGDERANYIKIGSGD